MGVVPVDDNFQVNMGDALAFVVDGTARGQDHDQFDVNRQVILGNSTLDLSGTIGDVSNGTVISLIDDDTSSDDISGQFSRPRNGGEVTINGQEFRIFYDGGDGNDVVLRAFDSQSQEQPAVVYVDDDDRNLPDGTTITEADPDEPGDQMASSASTPSTLFRRASMPWPRAGRSL
jgi:hypothetical protein